MSEQPPYEQPPPPAGQPPQPQYPQSPQSPPAGPQDKKSRKTAVIVVIVLAVVLLLGAAGVAGFLLTRKQTTTGGSEASPTAASPTAGAEGARGFDAALGQQFQELSGSAVIDGKTVPVRDGLVTGERVRFVVDRGPDQTMRFEGRLVDGRLEGKGWTATRK